MDRRITAEIDGGLLVARIKRNSIAAATGIKRAHRLVIEEVEGLKADLQTMFFTPRHLEGLADAEISVHIADIAEGVPFAGFAGHSVAEALKSLRRVAAKQRAATRRAGFNGSDPRAIALHVPVGRPTRVVVRR